MKGMMSMEDVVHTSTSVVSIDSVKLFAGGLAAVSALSTARIEQRVDDAIAKAESYGIDLTDLYYDFDVPGDQYPFGDGEDWMPASWKPPKTGDSKYLPTKMLGQIQIRTNQYEAIEKCKCGPKKEATAFPPLPGVVPDEELEKTDKDFLVCVNDRYVAANEASSDLWCAGSCIPDGCPKDAQEACREGKGRSVEAFFSQHALREAVLLAREHHRRDSGRSLRSDEWRQGARLL